jgi:hypothetical protein
MTPEEALQGLRIQIEAQGPDTPNRHYGRKQYEWLLGCCDTLQGAIESSNDEGDEDETVEGLAAVLGVAAEYEIEEMGTDELVPAWLTADDVANRIRERLKELKYWWDSVE